LLTEPTAKKLLELYMQKAGRNGGEKEYGSKRPQRLLLGLGKGQSLRWKHKLT
jgi:hypothetical protein